MKVLITGTSGGIGKAIAEKFISLGHEVIGIDKEASQLINDRYTHFVADIAKGDLPDVDGVEILVNNAGIIKRQDSIEFSEENWDSVMAVNLKTVFFLTQAVAKQFLKQGSGGKIINIASMLSYQGGIRVPSYTASKSAIKGITMTLSNEWAKYGINVNAIAPGYMATNNTQQLRQDEERSADILARIPAGRWGTPADLEGAAVFLASAASDYVNGFTLAVDGGWLGR